MGIKKHLSGYLAVIVVCLPFVAGSVKAGAPPVQEPSSVEDIKKALFGGVPGDKWKEGLLFEGIKPSPWMKSAANWFPGTEDVQPNEMRIIFMGSAPFIRPGQMNTAILVELGNGEFKIAFLAMPPYGEEGPVPKDTSCILGTLTDEQDWLVMSPYVVALLDGELVKTWEQGTAPEPEDILEEVFGP